MNRTNYLATKIEFLKGVGPAKAALLKKELNIKTYQDLIQCFPYRFIDKSEFHTVAQINPELPYVQLKGKIISKSVIGHKKNQRLVANFKDHTGRIELVWFKGIRWVQDIIQPNEEYVIFGKASLFNNKITISHPDIELASKHRKSGVKIQPLYHSTEKLKAKNIESKHISKMVQSLLIDLKANDLPEILNEDILLKNNFPTRFEAYHKIHFPKNGSDYSKALNRLKFDELFFIQMKLVHITSCKRKKGQ